jgi:8-oxo-dGTP diphosphatase
VDDEMVRVPVLAAGGIVLRRQQTPLIAVVRLRKRDEWVLPKGKLDQGETARAPPPGARCWKRPGTM